MRTEHSCCDVNRERRGLSWCVPFFTLFASAHAMTRVDLRVALCERHCASDRAEVAVPSHPRQALNDFQLVFTVVCVHD